MKQEEDTRTKEETVFHKGVESMRIIKMIALLTGFILLLLCGCQLPTLPADSSQSNAPSDVSSVSAVAEQSEMDWLLSSVYRNVKFAAYMSTDQYDALFGTRGLRPSDPVADPDGGSILYFFPAEFEEEAALFEFDLMTKTARTLLSQQDIGTTQSIKWMEWQPDGTLLLVIGYRYGTLSPGGALYLLHREEAPQLRLLYATRNEYEQVLSAQLQSNTLSLTIGVYDSEFLDYTEQSRTVTVNPSSAPVAQLFGVPDASPGTLAVIINQPDTATLAAYPNIDEYEHDQSGETMLVVPSQEGTRVTLETMEYSENLNEFVTTGVVYDRMSMAGQALYIRAARPEGGPQLRLTVTYGENTVGYFITYNGRDGTPEREELK